MAIELTDANFHNEVLASDKPVLVDFWAEWCGPCHMVAPSVEAVSQEFSDRAKVGKLNVDFNQMTAMEYNVRSIPTLLFFKDGKIVDQVVGAVPKRVLAEKLERLTSVDV